MLSTVLPETQNQNSENRIKTKITQPTETRIEPLDKYTQLQYDFAPQSHS